MAPNIADGQLIYLLPAPCWRERIYRGPLVHQKLAQEKTVIKFKQGLRQSTNGVGDFWILWFNFQYCWNVILVLRYTIGLRGV
jgi:hypothetical protein